ncbi:MAG TPA: hypothetical protein VEU30_12900, partial [Thermoanaerobaculia bacterium]|nr:hypothetical protein [Thermoanaerobaculia bacterium]
ALFFFVFALDAAAVSLNVPAQRSLHPVTTERKAKVLRDGRSSFTLPDGSQWVVHSVPAQSEPSALGVTRFAADAPARVFLVSDWLPHRTIPKGWAGQVYGVGMLNDGRVLVSAGWHNRTGSHNAIFVLRARQDGTYHTDKVIEVPGVGEVIGGPANTILAITTRPDVRGGHLLSHFSTEGVFLGGHAGLGADLPPRAAAQNAMHARLHRIHENQYALYDPSAEKVFVFNLRRGDGEYIWQGHGHIFLGEDAGTAGMRVLGMESIGDELVVVRSGKYRGRLGTLLTVFDRLQKEKQSEFLDVPWNYMLRESGEIHGVVFKDDVQLDKVAVGRD